jgi:hypothetical protein
MSFAFTQAQAHVEGLLFSWNRETDISLQPGLIFAILKTWVIEAIQE